MVQGPTYKFGIIFGIIFQDVHTCTYTREIPEEPRGTYIHVQSGIVHSPGSATFSHVSEDQEKDARKVVFGCVQTGRGLRGPPLNGTIYKSV